MLRTLLLSLLCLLLLGPQAAFPVSSGQAPPMTEKGLPLNRTTFHFFSPEDIAANYRSPKIVRVGYFDQHGVFEGEGEQLSGYAVALLTAISRYTGWEYEWVKIRFDELAQRLDDGSIDLSCGISYTPERARLFDFSKLRAGYENTCLHVASTSHMHYMDLEAFNGMRIGFFADSLQYEVMRHFADQSGFAFEPLFFEESSEMVQALADGRIDGYVDGVLQGKGTKVVATISTDPFFFVTRKGDDAVMDPLNEAMRQILLNHPSYLARLYDSYLNIASDVPVVFTRSECRWLATSPAIRVAYSRGQDMMDPEHGGNFLFAFLKMLERQSGIRFEYLPQPSYDACLQALAAGTADIMPDVYPKLSFLRSQGIASGKTYYNAPITVVGRFQSKKLPGQGCTVGFTSEMRSVMLAYKSTYPEDIPRILPDIEACRKAFEKGELDVYLWPYPAAPLQDDPPEDGLLLPTRAMYPMSLGISPHASPFVTSVLDKVITSHHHGHHGRPAPVRGAGFPVGHHPPLPAPELRGGALRSRPAAGPDRAPRHAPQQAAPGRAPRGGPHRPRDAGPQPRPFPHGCRQDPAKGQTPPLPVHGQHPQAQAHQPGLRPAHRGQPDPPLQPRVRPAQPPGSWPPTAARGSTCCSGDARTMRPSPSAWKSCSASRTWPAGCTSAR